MSAVMAAGQAKDPNAANDSVCIVLMKSPETDATLDYLAADHPHVKFSYYRGGIGTVAAEMH
mgnify:CR=1 FL=1